MSKPKRIVIGIAVLIVALGIAGIGGRYLWEKIIWDSLPEATYASVDGKKDFLIVDGIAYESDSGNGHVSQINAYDEAIAKIVDVPPGFDRMIVHGLKGLDEQSRFCVRNYGFMNNYHTLYKRVGLPNLTPAEYGASEVGFAYGEDPHYRHVDISSDDYSRLASFDPDGLLLAINQDEVEQLVSISIRSDPDTGLSFGLHYRIMKDGNRYLSYYDAGIEVDNFLDKYINLSD